MALAGTVFAALGGAAAGTLLVLSKQAPKTFLRDRSLQHTFVTKFSYGTDRVYFLFAAIGISTWHAVLIRIDQVRSIQ